MLHNITASYPSCRDKCYFYTILNHIITIMKSMKTSILGMGAALALLASCGTKVEKPSLTLSGLNPERTFLFCKKVGI